MSEKELREMSVDDIKAALQEVIDEIDAPAEDGNSVDELEKKSKDLMAELDRRDAEEKELEKRESKRQEILARIGSKGKEIRKGKPEMEERTFAPSSAEYRDAYLKNLQGKELDAEERAALSVSAVIPTDTMNMIVGKLETSPLLAAVDMTSIPGNVSYPVEGTINAASWVEMATAATDSADTIGAISLGAYKLIKTVEITADVKAMAIPAFEAWLTSRLANKINVAVDAAILVGTGSNQATGMLKSGEITNKGTFTKTAMAYKDLLKIIAAIPTQYQTGASFIMPRALFYGEVLGLETTSGDKVVVADVQSPAKFNILGYPVIVDDNCSADTIVFGDLKEGYKFNFAAPVEVTSDASVAFRSGSVVYRAMCLADGKVADKNALCLFTRATA